MARNNVHTRRIFGGKEGRVASGSQEFTRPLENPANQAVSETLAVGTTRRKFPGPQGCGTPWWAYYINVTSAAGATSTLKFYYSWLPDPDPETAAHWEDSGIAAIDLTAVDVSAGMKLDAAPLWIMAEAIVAASTGDVLGYVRTSGVE